MQHATCIFLFCVFTSSVFGFEDRSVVVSKRLSVRRGSVQEVVFDLGNCRLSQSIKCELEIDGLSNENSIVLESVSCGCLSLVRDEIRNHVIHGRMAAPVRPGVFQVEGVIRIGVDRTFCKLIIKGHARELVSAESSELAFENRPDEIQQLRVVTHFDDVDLSKMTFSVPPESVVTEVSCCERSRGRCVLNLRTDRDFLSQSRVVPVTINVLDGNRNLCNVDFVFRNRSRPDWIPTNPVFVMNSRGEWTCKILQRNRPLEKEQVDAFVVDAKGEKWHTLAVESSELGKSSRLFHIKTTKEFDKLGGGIQASSEDFYLQLEIDEKTIFRSLFRCDLKVGSSLNE